METREPASYSMDLITSVLLLCGRLVADFCHLCADSTESVYPADMPVLLSRLTDDKLVVLPLVRLVIYAVAIDAHVGRSLTSTDTSRENMLSPRMLIVLKLSISYWKAFAGYKGKRWCVDGEELFCSV